MIEQLPATPDKRIVRPLCRRDSPDLPGEQRQSELAAQPRTSPVPPQASRGADRVPAFQLVFRWCCPRAARRAGPGTAPMQGEANDDPMLGTSFARSDTGRDYLVGQPRGAARERGRHDQGRHALSHKPARYHVQYSILMSPPASKVQHRDKSSKSIVVAIITAVIIEVSQCRHLQTSAVPITLQVSLSSVLRSALRPSRHAAKFTASEKA